jgi:hypothetical protein
VAEPRSDLGTSTSGSPSEPEAHAAGAETIEAKIPVDAEWYARNVQGKSADVVLPLCRMKCPAEKLGKPNVKKCETRICPFLMTCLMDSNGLARPFYQWDYCLRQLRTTKGAKPRSDVAAATAVVPATETPQSAGAQPANVTGAAPQRPSQPPKPTRAKEAKAVGDPHLVNVYGQRFDILQPGLHTLIQVPKWAVVGRTLLTVSADAQQMGGACTDMYFQSLSITGNWTPKTAGLHFYAGHINNTYNAKWMHLGQVRLKVVWGHTGGGTRYLNLLLKNLSNIQFPIGGLLGEDDHTAASTPSTNCRKTVSL